MKKNLFVCLCAAALLAGCNTGGEATSNPTSGGTEVTTPTITPTGTSSSTSEPASKLDSVTNLKFENGVISFTGVQNAVDYLLTIKLGNTIVAQRAYTVTSIEIATFELAGGHYTAGVIARNGGITSDEVTVDFELLHKDVTQRLEAELALLDRDRNWADDEAASNDAYGLAFDDCGQGMYFRYYAFEAGQRDITVAYATGMSNSYMTMFANGNSYIVTFTENTGWFGDSKTLAEAVVEDVALIKGWNDIYMMKNGEATDDPVYGGYVQIDYIEVEGTNKEFDLDDFDMTSTKYTLEAEMAHWHYDNQATRPIKWENTATFNYGCGEFNYEGDGVRFDVTIAEEGTYAIRPVVGGKKSLKVAIDDGASEVVSFGKYSEWYEFQIASVDAYQVELTAGYHQIDIIRNGIWFTFDQLVIEKV